MIKLINLQMIDKIKYDHIHNVFLKSLFLKFFFCFLNLHLNLESFML